MIVPKVPKALILFVVLPWPAPSWWSDAAAVAERRRKRRPTGSGAPAEEEKAEEEPAEEDRAEEEPAEEAEEEPAEEAEEPAEEEEAGGESAMADEGKAIFSANCASCHTLKAAGATGTVGPNLDELGVDEATIEHQVINGGGPMPASARKAR